VYSHVPCSSVLDLEKERHRSHICLITGSPGSAGDPIKPPGKSPNPLGFGGPVNLICIYTPNIVGMYKYIIVRLSYMNIDE